MFSVLWLGGCLVFALMFWNRPAVVLAGIVAARVLIPGMAEGLVTPLLHPAYWLLVVHLGIQAVFAWPRVRRAMNPSTATLLLLLLLVGWAVGNGLSAYSAGPLPSLVSMTKVVLLPFLLGLLIRDEVRTRPRSETLLIWTLMLLGIVQVALGQYQMTTHTAVVYESLYRIQWWWNDYVFRALGTIGHGIQLGFFLAALIPLTLRLRRIWIRIVLSLTFVYGILLAEARLALLLALGALLVVVLWSLRQRWVATIVWAAAAATVAVPWLMSSDAFISVLTKFEDDQGSNEQRLRAFTWAFEHMDEFIWTGYPGNRDLMGSGAVGSSLENGYLIFGTYFGMAAAAVLALLHVSVACAALATGTRRGRAWPSTVAAVVTVGAFFGSSSFMAQALEGTMLFVFGALAWVGSSAPRWSADRAQVAVEEAAAEAGPPQGELGEPAATDQARDESEDEPAAVEEEPVAAEGETALTNPSGHTVILRAHRPDRPTLTAYRRLRRDPGIDSVTILADEVTGAGHSWPDDVDVLPITAPVLEELGLRTDIADAGWRCGDYALAVFLHRRPEVERVWLLEPDVAFVRISASQFMSRFDHDPAHYVVHSMAVQRPGGFWYGTLTSRGFEGTEWHSFFPLLRVSRPAVEATIDLRRQLQDRQSPLMHPNDETVVATAVAEAGLSWTAMKDVCPGMFLRFSPGRRLPLTVLMMLHRGPQVFHPVGRPDLLRHRRTARDVTG
ncbi:O-antigen ligase family protein [Micrococcus lylae]|uniref:O-antigen ligase family protein n=1 Tax=Micrococcus lylae TaxID=1273 RepID=UPI002155F165|nr:O-antigen ligase family protein [Micrococcus lylae]WIK82383.1 hypothetical protein CJ228_000695 [Micrococcus lylae]